MVIDTSALIAILRNEPDAAALRTCLSADPRRLISTVSVLEATCVLTSRYGAAAVVELGLFLAEFRLEQVPFQSDQLASAQKAWLRWGKGRHPAALNFGDCAAYGLSESSAEPLLFVGKDFAQTDVRRALP